MKTLHSDIAILGGGLTGLTLAYRLRNAGRSVRVFEARNRLGGRIHTVYPTGGPPVEMGATWLGRKHTALWKLLDELGLTVFEQRREARVLYQPAAQSPVQLVDLPPGAEPTYRIAGGSSRLIEALADRLSPGDMLTGHAVTSISRLGDQVEITTTKGKYTADTVVSTLPPDLLLRSVTFAPDLPGNWRTLAGQTDTWMGRSIKVALVYDHPFWRAPGRSGTLFSNAGPVTEMYDHADVADTAYALKAFVDPRLGGLTADHRRARVLEQLGRVYGPAVLQYSEYVEAPWAAEPYTTHVAASELLPHQNQGAMALRQPRWEGQLWMAGTETAAEFPGYMEGAVRSGEATAAALPG